MSGLSDPGLLPPLKSVIAEAGLVADKRLGQHFLLDPNILSRIVEAAEVRAGEHVLEIGPGPGGLTRALLARGAYVTAIERDRRCLNLLEPLVDWSSQSLKTVLGDGLQLSPISLMAPHPFKIVANLPYNVGTEMLIRWLLAPEGIEAIHVLLQKEVVDRLISYPSCKAYGRLTVLAQLTASLRKHFDLPAGAFHPPPKVQSSLIGIVPRPDVLPKPVLAALQRVTHAAFGQRRKMLRTSLKALPVTLPELLDGLDITPEQRPETLSPTDFLGIARNLAAHE